METNEVCFSPPGPGQCQPWPSTTPPHNVPEPDIIFLLLIAAGIAFIAWVVKKGKKKK